MLLKRYDHDTLPAKFESLSYKMGKLSKIYIHRIIPGSIVSEENIACYR